MTFNSSTILIISIFFLIISFSIFIVFLKNRKRSAKNIYKLINDLEKKYIY